MEILARPKIVSSETMTHVVQEGLTIEEMLLACNWDMALRKFTVVMLNGHEIEERNWSRVRPKPAAQVFFALRPKDGGSQILQVIAIIAVVIAAAYLGPMVAPFLIPAGASAATAAAITAGVTASIGIAGTMLIGAFIKPPSMAQKAITSNPDTNNAPSEGSLYGVSAAGNPINRYSSVPKLFGRARITPNQAAEPYVISSGPVQILRLLLDFGYSPLMIEDIRIGNTPIADFPTARYVIHTWFKKGMPLQIYTLDNATSQVNIDLFENVENIRTAPQPGKNLYIDFSFSQGLVQMNQQGGVETRTEYVQVHIRPVGGAWSAIGDFPHRSMFSGEDMTSGVGGERQLNSQAYDLAWKAQNAISWDITKGEQPQIGDFIRWNNEDFQITNVGAWVNPPGTSDWPAGYRWLYLTGLPSWIDWNFIGGTYSFGPWGPGAPQANLIRKSYTASVGPITITFGPGAEMLVMTGRSRAARTVAVMIEMPYEAVWEVRVYRQSPVSSDALVANHIGWVNLRAERMTAPIAPNTYRTIMEVEIAASEQVNGQVQNINALATTYYWNWNGGYWMPHRNPGLAYIDLLTHESNKKKVGYDKIDLPKIQEWINKCEAVSAQGDITATCDLLVESRTTLGEVAQTICSAGRAIPTMINGKYSVIMEEEVRSTIQVFTNRNTRSMTTSRVWVDEPHAVKVRYLSEVTWERDEIIVYMDGYSESNATRFENLDLVGTTRPWQAWRMGRYYLAQIRLRKETMEVETDVENLVCQRGDLVGVASDQLLNSQVARVMQIFGGSLILDSYLSVRITPPLIEYDFRMGALPADTVFTRASKAAKYDNSLVAAGIPRFNPTGGLTLEGLRTNVIQNPKGIGGVIGPDTSGGIPPNRWREAQLNNLTMEFVARDQMFQNIPYQRMRWFGTTNNAAAFRFGFELRNFFAVTAGEYYTFSIFMKFPITAVVMPVPYKIGITFWDAGAVYVTEVSQTIVVDSTSKRYEITVQVPATAGIVTACPTFIIPLANGQTWDFTIDFGLPVMELGRFASTPVYDAQVAYTREADEISTTIPVSINVFKPWMCEAYMKIDPRGLGSSWAFIARFNGSNYAGIRDINGSFSAMMNIGGTVTTTPMGPVDRTKPIKIRMEFTGTGSVQVFLNDVLSIQVPCAVVAYNNVYTGINYYTELYSYTFQGATEPPAGTGYQVRTSTGYVTVQAPIISMPADDNVIIDDPTAAQLTPGDLIIIGDLTSIMTYWLVDRITPGGDLSAKVKLIEAAPAVNDADTGAIPGYVPPNSDSGIPVYLGPARFLSILVGQDFVDGVSVNIVKVDWSPPLDYIAPLYLVERLITGGARQLIARTSDTFYLDVMPSVGIPSTGAGVSYWITPLTNRGGRGQTAGISGIISPDLSPPTTPELTANVMGDSTRLIWNRPEEPDTAGYQIRWSPDYANVEWNDMQILIDSVTVANTTSMIHSRSGVYAIRAVDLAGNWSGVSYIRTIIDLPIIVDASYTVHGPAWIGTMVNVELNGSGHLVLKKDTTGNYFPEGYFEFASPLSLTSVWKLRLQTNVVMTVFPDPGVPIVTHDAQIMLAIAKDIPELSDPWFTPLSSADPLVGSPDNYGGYSTIVTEWVEGMVFWTRVYLFSKDGIHTPVVQDALVDFFFDPRSESANDVLATGGVLEVNYRYPYVQTPGLQITLNDAAKGDYVTRTRNDAQGFRIEIRNSADALTARHVDWLATGIGIGP